MTPLNEDELEALLAEVVDYHERHGALPPNLPPAVSSMAARYLELTLLLDEGARGAVPAHTPLTDKSGGLPVIDGFRTIERLGAGGMGEVYKLQDLKLDRVVAGKVIRQRGPTGHLPVAMQDFLREAKSLALFSDHRIVQIFECRLDVDPPVIIMEYVDGFELGRLGPSLEIRQRATVMREIADAVDHAHDLGIQHRDLKPSNIMLDGALRPKILDFGLSDDRPDRGHLRGTVQYVAPEQLDPSQPIDRRTDVYALGVILYELLCGVTPYRADSTAALLEAVKIGQPRLPIEINPTVPAPLQAIALKAMELKPADRYQTADEMARDIDRYLAGQPVEARPTQYAQTLAARTNAHLTQVSEWLRLKLIYPHEAERLRATYKSLEKREDDWIVASRVLSYSQIVLYLGAFVLLVGSGYYFYARRVLNVEGLANPLMILGAPFVGLNLAGRWLYKRDHQAVAIAFYLAGVCILPLFLSIELKEFGLFAGGTTLIGDITNRQLQITVGLALLWSAWLAIQTRTGALSVVALFLIFIFTLALLADFGLADWLPDDLDKLSVRLMVLIPIYGVLGWMAQKRDLGWLARPSFIAAVLMLVLTLDLLAANGRMFLRFGISVEPLQPESVMAPDVLPTTLALSLNGAIFYIAAAILARRSWTYLDSAAQFLFIIAPFSILEPLAYLCARSGDVYKEHFDWLYLSLSVAIAVMSHFRQRKSFYYAGLINTGLALSLIANRHGWYEKRAWSVTLVLIGLAGLLVGYWFDARRRRAK